MHLPFRFLYQLLRHFARVRDDRSGHQANFVVVDSRLLLLLLLFLLFVFFALFAFLDW